MDEHLYNEHVFLLALKKACERLEDLDSILSKVDGELGFNAKEYYELLMKQAKEEIDSQIKSNNTKMNKEKYFDLGEDLNGGNLFDVDLNLALMTGRDIDGADIPNNTPEERNKGIEKKIEVKDHER